MTKVRMSNRQHISPPICPYCGKPSVLVADSTVYARSYGSMVYLCAPCKAWVGVHKNTNPPIPLGRLATAELRALKIRAHAAFDKLWRAAIKFRKWRRNKARNLAYAWLAREMGIEVDRCHIGMFDIDQTNQAIAICEAVITKKVGNA
jgi:hypothetical protein